MHPLHHRFKDLCRERGVSQRSVFKAIGVHQAYFHRPAKNGPRPDIAAKMATYFDISVNELTGKPDRTDDAADFEAFQAALSIVELISPLLLKHDKAKIAHIIYREIKRLLLVR